MDEDRAVMQRCQALFAQLLRYCQEPPVAWSMSQAMSSYNFFGLALAAHGGRELILNFQDPMRFEKDGLEIVSSVGIPICIVSFLTVKLWTNVRLQEVVAVLTVQAAFAFITLLSACLADDLQRIYAMLVLTLLALFPPLVLRWRVGASLVYALLNSAKDLALNWLGHAKRPEMDPFALEPLLFISAVMYVCYVAISFDTRRHYRIEMQLTEEKESMRSLLQMQCEAVISLDIQRRIIDNGLSTVLGDSVIGKSLFDCLAEGETTRLSTALETVKSTKQASLLPTTFSVNGNETRADLFLVSSGKDSFLVGVRLGQEVVPPNADVEASQALQQNPKPVEAGMAEDVVSVSHFPPSSERGTDYVFEVRALRGISEIVKVGNREHWLIEKSSMDFTRSSHLGEGGFGEVVSAEFRGAEVAVKSPRLRMQTDEQKKQVLLELRMLRHLRHPNIVEFFGAAVEISDAHFAISLVFELVGGGVTCADIIRTLDYEGGLDKTHQELLLHILKDTCSALSYMHGLKPAVVHRDVKASNILCSISQGASVRAKLCDFGLSHQMGTEKTGGTAKMMAPEALLNQSVTTAADVFAFGRLLFMVLAGGSPLSDMNRASLKKLASEGRLPSLDWDTVPNCSWPEEAISVCQQLSRACLHFHSEERPSIDYVFKQISSLWRLFSATSESGMPLSEAATVSLKPDSQQRKVSV